MSHPPESATMNETVDPNRVLQRKTVYSYDPGTGAFLGADVAFESPLETGIFHIPANATEAPPPPAGAMQRAVFANGAWRLVTDKRGMALYAKDTGQRAGICTALGDLPGAVTELAPALPTDKWNGSAWVSAASPYDDWTGSAWVLSTVRATAAQLAQFKSQVLAALTLSDATMYRITEAVSMGLNTWVSPDVAAWATYRRQLRAALSATSVGTAAPAPPFPAGT